jgi:hypothetical protein
MRGDFVGGKVVEAFISEKNDLSVARPLSSLTSGWDGRKIFRPYVMKTFSRYRKGYGDA